MVRRILVAFAGFALVASAATTAQAGTIALWSGSGDTGADPYGHTWVLNSQGNGDGAWGIPGLFEGTLLWNGPTIADFHIVFDLPVGVVVDPDPIPTGPGGSDESTRFSNLTDNVLWTRTITGNRVDFVASPGGELDFGESFFVNVAFTGAVPAQGFAFDAEYTGNVVPVPPAAWLGFGMLGLLGAARRLRRRS